jgi:hypothetical protein
MIHHRYNPTKRNRRRHVLTRVKLVQRRKCLVHRRNRTISKHVGMNNGSLLIRRRMCDAIFRLILNDLLTHDASWPFQTAVDSKQHPDYYECIKYPMDLSTIKIKMHHKKYNRRDDFLHDVELLLNNCEFYNEDDSPVGKAGHILRTWFQIQWKKRFN